MQVTYVWFPHFSEANVHITLQLHVIKPQWLLLVEADKRELIPFSIQVASTWRCFARGKGGVRPTLYAAATAVYHSLQLSNKCIFFVIDGGETGAKTLSIQVWVCLKCLPACVLINEVLGMLRAFLHMPIQCLATHALKNNHHHHHHPITLPALYGECI